MLKQARYLISSSSSNSSKAKRQLLLLRGVVDVVVGDNSSISISSSGGNISGGGFSSRRRTYISRCGNVNYSVSGCYCSCNVINNSNNNNIVWYPIKSTLFNRTSTSTKTSFINNTRSRCLHLSARMPNIINDIKLDFKDVLLRPKRSTLKSRSDVDLFREITFLNSKQTYRGIPVMASNMDTVGTFDMAKALSKHGLFTTVHKYYTAEEWIEFARNNPDCLKNMAASSGTGNDDFERLSTVLAAIPELSFICIDVANGYSQHFVEYVRKVRAQFPRHTIIAGNVVTGEMVEELILSGADIIKVGIGPGSVCTTRMKTGVGYPQLSAVIECADAAHGLKGHIISDGGCICPGDIAKAFGAGADFVMAGGMFAGHDECGGEVIEKDGKKYKLFYGMASNTAMKKHAGGVADYRSSEGKTVEVPYKGSVDATVLDVLGGLRSACTYVGASRLRELPKRATFIRCTQQLNNIFGSPF